MIICQISDYTFEIINNPRKTISKFDQDLLTFECSDVARNGFGNPNISEDEIRERILDTSISVFAKNSFGRIVAFSTSSIRVINDYHVIYLPSSVVSKECSSKGIHNITLYLRLVEEVRKIKERCPAVSENHILIAGRTQSPLVYRILHRKLGLYPNIDGKCDEKVRDVAEKLAYSLYDETGHLSSKNDFIFDRDYLVSKKSYVCHAREKELGVNLYNENIPFCRDDDEINTYMENHLDWQNGDALIMIGFYCQDKVQTMFDQAREQISRRLTAAA